MRMKAILIMGLAVLLAADGVSAEQIRLRSGDLLQGDLRGEESDEVHLSVELYSTGGVIRLRWDQLIKEDERRLRDNLGLASWEEEDVPVIDGHHILFKNNVTERGLAVNPDETNRPLILRTYSGDRSYPRDTISKITPILVDVLEIYTPEGYYQVLLAEFDPKTPQDHVNLAKECVRIEAYRQARDHFNLALEDPEFQATEQAQMVRNQLQKVEVFVKAEVALERVRGVKKLLFQKRFDEGLAEIAQIRQDHQEDTAILKILNLDRLEANVSSGRRKHFLFEVRRLFFRNLEDLVAKKVREKDPENRDKEIGLNTIRQWIQNPRGLGQEVVSAIAEKTGLSEQETRELWSDRQAGQVKRYNHGEGTFMHPEVVAQITKLTRPAGNQRQTGGSSRNPRGRPAARQQGPKLMSADEWWTAATTKERRDWAKAWFAEFGGGMLEVLRIETKPCRSCGGMGYTVSNSVGDAEQIKLVCPTCNFAQHERVVICR